MRDFIFTPYAFHLAQSLLGSPDFFLLAPPLYCGDNATCRDYEESSQEYDDNYFPHTNCALFGQTILCRGVEGPVSCFLARQISIARNTLPLHLVYTRLGSTVFSRYIICSTLVNTPRAITFVDASVFDSVHRAH